METVGAMIATICLFKWHCVLLGPPILAAYLWLRTQTMHGIETVESQPTRCAFK